MIRAVCDALVAVVVAPVCAACRQPLPHPIAGAVCSPCWRAIPPPPRVLCRICGDTLPTSHMHDEGARCARCVRTQRTIAVGRSIAPYEGTLRDILHALKYEGRQSLAAPLGRRMAAAGAEVLDGADIAVPVPLHFWRLYRRGFNQAAELARHLDVPVVDALRRTRATVTQTDLPEAARHANVRGAFALRSRVRVAGAVVVVVDDVSTTGATLDACARVLLEAGAREVRALTAARAAARI